MRLPDRLPGGRAVTATTAGVTLRPSPHVPLDVGGEPTSVATAGRWLLVAVNTSASFVNPGGRLLVLDPRTRQIVREFPTGGQPDSVAVSPDGRYAAIVIENERDEDLNDGLLPQLPAGSLQILDLKGPPRRWSGLRTVDLTGLADTGPTDPEPEFVDINRRNEAVVTLQENNHLAVVDLRRGRVTRDFSAGATDVTGVDATEEKLGPQRAGLIELTEDLPGRRREPDAVHWIDDDTFATANEGDYEDAAGVEGGSRGFTLFNKRGYVEWESGSSFEHEIISAGHFPEGRAANKGVEPEGLEVARIRGRTYLFVGAERANVVGVYDVTRGTPAFQHVLATGSGPEGIRAIPQRGLLASLTAGATSSGLEGVTVTGTQSGGDETVWVVVQREWADDAKGVVKLGRYDVASGEWTFANYPLDAVASPAGGWVGLSEITLMPDGHRVAVVERDNQLGSQARIKRIYGVDLADPAVTFKPHGDALDTVRKSLLADVIGDLDAHSITVPDKLEGVGIAKDGRVFLSTDNDGVDGNVGESLFFKLATLR